MNVNVRSELADKNDLAKTQDYKRFRHTSIFGRAIQNAIRSQSGEMRVEPGIGSHVLITPEQRPPEVTADQSERQTESKEKVRLKTLIQYTESILHANQSSENLERFTISSTKVEVSSVPQFE
jgi:hypothetical protein